MKAEQRLALNAAPPQLVGLVVIDIAIQNQKAEEEGGNEEIINQQANYELILKRVEGETKA